MNLDFEKQIDTTEQEKDESKDISLFSHLNIFQKKKQKNDLLLFTRNFASLAKDGLPLLTSLDTLASKTENEYLKKIIIEAKEEVKTGTPLYICLKKHSNIFSNLYCDLIKTGEETGRLDQVLERLSNLLSSCEEIDKKVNESIEFPSRVAFYGFIEVSFLMTYVVPKFSVLYDGYFKPRFTTIVLDIGFWFQHNIIYVFIFLLSSWIVYYLLRMIKPGRYITDFMMLKIPVFGNLINKHLLIHYSRNIVTLYNSGISFISSMKKCNETVKNLYLKKVLDNVVRDIEAGTPITNAFDKTKFFPKKSINIIETGEESGYIDEMFTEIANNYEKESLYLAKQINIMVKPIYVVIMSLICGAVFFSLCMPLYSMLKALAPK